MCWHQYLLLTWIPPKISNQPQTHGWRSQIRPTVHLILREEKHYVGVIYYKQIWTRAGHESNYELKFLMNCIRSWVCEPQFVRFHDSQTTQQPPFFVVVRSVRNSGSWTRHAGVQGNGQESFKAVLPHNSSSESTCESCCHSFHGGEEKHHWNGLK